MRYRINKSSCCQGSSSLRREEEDAAAVPNVGLSQSVGSAHLSTPLSLQFSEAPIKSKTKSSS